jgi:beta-galactosidase
VQHASGTVTFGDAPVDIAPGTIARWPFGLDLSGTRVNWATASALTLLGDGTLVLVAEPGLDVQISVGSGLPTVVVDGELGGTVQMDGLTVLVIGSADARRVWVLGASRTVALCDEPLWENDGHLVVRASTIPHLQVWDPAGWQVVELRPVGVVQPATPVPVSVLRVAAEPLASYGSYGGRPSAPTALDLIERSALYQLDSVGPPEPHSRRDLFIDWAGDVAQLLVHGEVVADRFWDGTPWHIDLDVFKGASHDAVSLRILPLHSSSCVGLPAEAEHRRRSTEGSLGALDSVRLAWSTEWHAPR